MRVKKAVAMVLAIALSVSSLVTLPKSNVKAAGFELENGKYYDVVVKGGTTETYTFTVPGNGYFRFYITPDYYTYDGEIGSNGEWWMSYEVVVSNKTYESGDAWNIDGTLKTQQQFSFAKGTKVELKISSGDDSRYEDHANIGVIYTECSGNFETEKNDKKSLANTLKVNKAYKAVSCSHDTDWFVFTAPETGKYKLAMMASDELNSWGYEFEMSVNIYDTSKKVLSSYELKGIDNSWEKVYQKKLKKGQKIFIKNMQVSGSALYKMKIKK